MPVYYDKRFFDYVIADRYYRRVKAIGCNLWDKAMRIKYHMPVPANKSSTESTRRSRGLAALGASTPLFRRWQKSAFISYSADEIIQDLLDYQPKILRASASYLRLVAEALVDQGIDDLHLKAASTVGELMDEPTRHFIESAFGCPVFNEYGAAEVGSIGRECQQKEGFHEHSDFVILEVIKNGEPAAPGEVGDIVVTGLLNYAMPIIRYRVGDIGVLGDHLCSCGSAFPLLKSVEGRSIDSFILPDGSAVTAKEVMTVIQGTPGVSRYCAVQESVDKVRIELMARPRDPPVAVDELVAKCHGLLGDDVEVQVSITDRKNLKAKFRPVISKLTVAGDPRWTKPRR